MALAEIGVVGTIGHVGGANTELGHQVTCWLGMGMQVHIVPAQPLDQHAQEVAQQYRQSGCIYHAAQATGPPWKACTRSASATKAFWRICRRSASTPAPLPSSTA